MTQPITGSSSTLTRNAVPGAPVQPGNASRPASWPGSAPAATASPWVPPDERVQQAPTSNLTPCTGMRVIARVGSEAIFESDVAGAVNEKIEANKAKIPAKDMDAIREMLIKQQVKNLIETKLISQDAKHTIPAEGLTQFEKKLGEIFDDEELAKMMQKSGVETRQEFDRKLRSLGTSIERERRAFIERTLAQQWIAQQVKKEEEITYDQMVTFYRQNLKEFTTPSRAQWEELMVRYAKYPTKNAAFDAIARMGNQILAGAPFDQVAKAGSDGSTAANGGRRSWTSKGSLTIDELNTALFTQPIGQMGPIIAGDRGYHIIRVTQREEEAVRPFLEAQLDIKKKIVEQRKQKMFKEYMANLQKRTPVWTIYDGTNNGQLQMAAPPQQQPTRR